MAKRQKGAARASSKTKNPPKQTEKTSSKLISKPKFLQLRGMKKQNDRIAGENGKALSTAVKDAVANDGLNRIAWGIAMRLDKLEQFDRDAVVFHLNGYARHLGWTDQGDLFKNGEKPNGAAEDDDSEQGELPGATHQTDHTIEH